MSLSSETTSSLNNLVALGYERQHVGNNYYTAQPVPGVGVCIAFFIGRAMVQFFPWDSSLHSAGYEGHWHYASYLQDKASNPHTQPVGEWPYFDLNTQSDLLTIKCAVEEGLKQKGIVRAD